ncbi:S-adenosylmethionine carrier 1, chloroplastic/mitochondrial-like [Apium graveolens]|uniref:S-adenosylmethionine carrier 1, chloroplastic/mitochondrial-like n=1 Tax=Apium graveolens TaxID=4045 RepID=UPI003D7A6F6D
MRMTIIYIIVFIACYVFVVLSFNDHGLECYVLRSLEIGCMLESRLPSINLLKIEEMEIILERIGVVMEIIIQGLYRGSLPAVLDQFSCHGLRTGIFEASKLVLIIFAPTLHDIQVQSAASFCSTVKGTTVRIPCEVLKQQLQAGIFDNVGEAIVGTWQQDGLKGFFRGTGATLCREVPFYVAGMGLYAKPVYINLSL